jgi:hypothetical protein
MYGSQKYSTAGRFKPRYNDSSVKDIPLQTVQLKIPFENGLKIVKNNDSLI